MWHDGAAAPTAEALMRSRYVAYVLGLQAYLLETWHSSTRPVLLDLAGNKNLHWLGLQVRRHELTESTAALVEFVARYRIDGGRVQRLHEISRFVCESNRWHYVDGLFPGEKTK